MLRISAMILALALVSACGGGGGSNPLQAPEEEEETDTDTGEDTGTDSDPIDGGRNLPPGTANPSPNTEIVRYEDPDGSTDGAGTVTNVRYDPEDTGADVFLVDGLPFDGNNIYTRGTAVDQLGSYAVYESDPAGEFHNRAIYGVSDSGTTEFIVVRPTDYNSYGFRGFIYQRNGGVNLPTTGTAIYTGDYAGVRVYQGVQSLDYVTGDAEMVIDFEDFDDALGTTLRIRNRRLYDLNGNDVTSEYLDALMDDNTNGIRPTATNGTDDALPDIAPVIRNNGGDSNGEIVNGVYTQLYQIDDTPTRLSDGEYYAIVAGENADEVVGVLVMTGTDPRHSVPFEETGGFILTSP